MTLYFGALFAYFGECSAAIDAARITTVREQYEADDFNNQVLLIGARRLEQTRPGS